MAKYTVTQNFNDPNHNDIRYRGDVVEVSDDTPEDDDAAGKQRARYQKDLVSRGLLVEGELSKEDLDKRDEEAAKKDEDEAAKVGDGTEPQTEENVEADPNSPKAPADDLIAPGVAAKDVPDGEEKLKKGRQATKDA